MRKGNKFAVANMEFSGNNCLIQSQLGGIDIPTRKGNMTAAGDLKNHNALGTLSPNGANYRISGYVLLHRYVDICTILCI